MPIDIIFSEDVQKKFHFLMNQKTKKEIVLCNAIQKKIEILKTYPHYGNPISKNKFPQRLIDKFDITNLFRVELPFFWRMMYSLVQGENKITIIIFIVIITDHKEYNRLFGYRRK